MSVRKAEEVVSSMAASLKEKRELDDIKEISEELKRRRDQIPAVLSVLKRSRKEVVGAMDKEINKGIGFVRDFTYNILIVLVAALSGLNESFWLSLPDVKTNAENAVLWAMGISKDTKLPKRKMLLRDLVAWVMERAGENFNPLAAWARDKVVADLQAGLDWCLDIGFWRFRVPDEAGPETVLTEFEDYRHATPVPIPPRCGEVKLQDVGRVWTIETNWSRESAIMLEVSSQTRIPIVLSEAIFVV